MSDHIIKTAVSALAGAFVGWTVTAATLGSRVEAIEKAVMRIELRMDQQQAAKAPATP